MDSYADTSGVADGIGNSDDTKQRIVILWDLLKVSTSDHTEKQCCNASTTSIAFGVNALKRELTCVGLKKLLFLCLLRRWLHDA